jgi:hypothetical protein
MKDSAKGHNRECCKGSHGQEDGGHLLEGRDSIRSIMQDCDTLG